MESTLFERDRRALCPSTNGQLAVASVVSIERRVGSALAAYTLPSRFSSAAIIAVFSRMVE